jgi:hypothetical protein
MSTDFPVVVELAGGVSAGRKGKTKISFRAETAGRKYVTQTCRFLDPRLSNLRD